MADWKKIEHSPEEPVTAAEESAPTDADAAADKKAQKAAKQAEKAKKKKQELLDYARRLREKESEKNARFDRNGRRRGRFSWAPAVGFVMSLLAIIGVIALVFGAVTMIRGLSDDTALRTEAYYFLQPLMAYNPFPEFDDVNAEDLDGTLQAAVWRITEAERIRMLREKDDNTAYELDESGRLVIAAQEVEESYQYLFGSEAVLNHRSLENDDLEYSEVNACYYVPFNFITSLYQPVIDTVRRGNGGSYHVKVAYVSVNDLEVDEHGNTIDPTPDMASFAQIYVLRRVDGHFVVTMVGEEAAS